MLYVFAGYPKSGLNAGGLQYCIEEVEYLAKLEHDPMISYTKEGVYAIPRGSNEGEWLGNVEYRLSPTLEREGITWQWFPEHWGFGNGVTIHKSTANRETMLIDHRSGMALPDLTATGHPIEFGKLIIQQVPKRTEGWDKYEARWLPGTCPQESHLVSVTWFITKSEMDTLAYNRIQRLIEDPSAMLVDVERYREKDFSPTRQWDGKGESKERLALLEGLR